MYKQGFSITSSCHKTAIVPCGSTAALCSRIGRYMPARAWRQLAQALQLHVLSGAVTHLFVVIVGQRRVAVLQEGDHHQPHVDNCIGNEVHLCRQYSHCQCSPREVGRFPCTVNASTPRALQQTLRACYPNMTIQFLFCIRSVRSSGLPQEGHC